MKFSSPANIALASIALSSPNLLSSPVFVNAAPTGDPGTLSPNLGAGCFGTSPQMHATDSPVMPTMPSPSTSKIAGRRHSLRRSRTIKHRRGESSSRNIDPLGLGVNAGDIQPKAESIFRPRAAPAGLFSGTLGTVDPFSPIVGPGGLLANTGLVPPNTPILGGVPLSDGVDPSTLVGAIPAVVPIPGVDNVIQNIQNTAIGTPGSLLSPLTTGSLPFVDGLSPSLGTVPISLPQAPGASIPVLGNLPQLPGAIPPLAGGLPSVQGVASQATGTVPQLSNVLSLVPGVPQLQPGSLPVAAPNVNGLAPPVALPNLGASPNAAMPPIAGALPQAPELLADPRVPDSIPQLPGTVSQVPNVLSQAVGGTAMVPQVPGILSPARPLSKVNPDYVTPSLAGSVPVPVGSGSPLASPVVPAPGSVAPMDNLPVFATSVVPVSSFALPTPGSGPDALSALLPNSDAPPASAMDDLTQPIQSFAPYPVSSSNSVPHIIVSGPDAVGTFEPLEGVGAGATQPPSGAQTESNHPGSGIPSMESGEFDGSAVEPGATSRSEQPTADPTTSELAPTTLAKPIAKLDVPTTTDSLASKPTPTDAQLTTSPESTPNVNEIILPVQKRWESKLSSLPSDIGSSVTDKSGSPLLSEGIPVPTSPVYVPSATRLTGPSQESLSVSRSASVVTLKSFSMSSITESTAPIPIPAQTAPPVIGGAGSSLNTAQPADLVPKFSDDSLSSHSSSDERPSHVSSTIIAVASSPITTPYTGGVPLSRTLERSADTPSSTVAISGDSPDMPSPTFLGSGTSTGSQDGATRKIFRWGVPRMVKSRIRSATTVVKK